MRKGRCFEPHTTEYQATLEILHVHERRCGHKALERSGGDLAPELRSRLAEFGVPLERVSISQANGTPASEIVRHAREGASNLIIVGNHESRPLANALAEQRRKTSY